MNILKNIPPQLLAHASRLRLYYLTIFQRTNTRHTSQAHTNFRKPFGISTDTILSVMF